MTTTYDEYVQGSRLAEMRHAIAHSVAAHITAEKTLEQFDEMVARLKTPPAETPIQASDSAEPATYDQALAALLKVVNAEINTEGADPDRVAAWVQTYATLEACQGLSWAEES